ncbi:MAG: DUF4838 domain-containing protein [Abditibacteriota bacterium]|nr:DUF4838 domain-containing protein [Abditibacteriota bacterium]
MKKLFISLIVIILSISVFAINNMPNPKWENSLKPKGDAITFSLKDCVIVTPENPNPKETRATEDLKSFLSKMTGFEIPVIKDTEYNEGRIISVGNTILFQTSPFSQDKTEEEGYGIKGDENALYLFGGERRGPLYSVYALLEEDNGFRFWTTNREEDFIPSSDEITFVQRIVNPDFEIRTPYIRQANNTDFAILNRLNYIDIIPKELGGAWESWGGLAHTTFNFVWPEHQFKQNPEYFATEDGIRQPHQICWSNRAVLYQIGSYICELRKTNDFDCVNISPQDGYPLCECEECKKIYEPEGSKSACVINGLNYIIDLIHREYPDMKVITLAYLDYVKPPKTIRPNKDITVVVCSDSCDWPYPLCTIDETDKFRNDLFAWTKLGIKTQTWTYVVNFDHYLIPNPNLLVTAKNNKIIRDLGASGVFMQGNYGERSISDSGRMKAWVWSKLLWNPNLDPEGLMKDFIYGYYGECAEPIYKYETSLLNLWKQGHKKPHNLTEGEEEPFGLGAAGIRWTPEAPLYTDKWVKSSMSLMDEALKLAKSDKMKERVKFERISPLYLTLCRNIGYRNASGWHNTCKNKLSKKDIEYYTSLVEEFEDLYKSIDCKDIQELPPFYENLDLTLNKWKATLSVDFSAFKVNKLDNKGWKFTLDANNSGAKEQFFNPNYNTKAWKTFETEKPWNQQGIKDWTGNAWYKKKIKIGRDVLSKPYIYMYCKGIDEEATIYINGKKVFERTLASTGLKPIDIWDKPMKFDVKDFLIQGENDITIMVGNPGGYNGGIYDKILVVSSIEDLGELSEDIYDMF